MAVNRVVGVVGSLTAALLASCAVGPDFLRPEAPTIEKYTESQPTRTASTDVADGASQHLDSGKDVEGEWWHMFKSRPLDDLVDESLRHNPSLDTAKAALRQAQQLTYAQYGAFFPLIQANYIPTRWGLGSPQVNANLSSPLGTGPAPSTFNLQTGQVLVSYTFDVWGVNRRTIESLQAQTDFQRFQAEAAYLTLTSSVVVAAITEASLRAQIDATNKIIDANVKMLDILHRQFDAGYAARTDVAAQEAALAQVRATLPPLRKALQQNRDLIAALAGRFPSEDPKEKFMLAALHLPTDLPLSLPSQLLEQRPDVRSAEEQLHAASAGVGIAVGAMLPTFTLSATGGYIEPMFASNLIQQANQFFTVSGGVMQPVFDGLTLWHKEQSSEAALEQAVAQYRSTVIGAVQNVADALRALQNDADALKAAYDFERASKISLDLAQQQMQTGQINILLLLTAQTTYQQSVIGRVQAQASRLSDTVALYTALGGGWWNRDDLAEPKKHGEPSYFGTLAANIPWVVRAATATPSATATTVAAAAPGPSSTTDVAAAPAVDAATTQTSDAAPN